MSPARLPEIVLCAPEHADLLASEFSRYARDYDGPHLRQGRGDQRRPALAGHRR